MLRSVILIISDAVDGHARLVHRRLLEKGAESAIFDVGEVPARANLSAWVAPGRAPRLQVRREREPTLLDLGKVDTLWFRRLNELAASPDMPPEDQEFAKNESVAMLHSLEVLLADRFWVNPVTAALATDGGNGKIGHLELARGLGLAVPRTLATNDPDEARAFVSECAAAGSGAIYKPFRSPVRTRKDEDDREQPAAIFTTRLDASALEKLDGVRHAPCIFQELVPKRLELRVTVMGNKVFACEIHSQVRVESAVDFRRDQGMASTPHAPHDLPREIADALLALHARLGLVYGADDLILTPDGRYVFLEVNQQGQFLWLEELAGLPLLENFTEMLIQGRPDFSCDAPAHEPRPFPPLD
jgi:glutathione synthase/RimK-type ligase-like ATP-grasp enzyme